MTGKGRAHVWHPVPTAKVQMTEKRIISFEVSEYDPEKHEKLWVAFLKKYSDITPYHTREWAKVVKKVFNFKEKSLVCIDSEGNLTGILPLWLVNKHRVINSPWRDRADMIVLDSMSGELIQRWLSDMPYDLILKDWSHGLPSANFFLEKYWITSCVDLTGGEEFVCRGLNSSVHRNIRKARKLGVEIIQDTTYEGMMKFYLLFRKTRKRLGVPIYMWDLFESMLSYLNNGMMRLYLGYLNGHAISGALFLDTHNASIYAYGASDYKYQSTRVNDLLFFYAILDSINLKKGLFDFGADSPGQESLLRFKRKWGAVQKTLPTAHNIKGFDIAKSDFSSQKYHFARQLLSCFPEWMLTCIGSFMSKRNG